MPVRTPGRSAQSPAELLVGLNQGLNLYTDPTQCNPKMWADALNVYSGSFGYIQRARFANVVTNAQLNLAPPLRLPFLSMKYYAVPGLSSYLLADQSTGIQWSFDTALGYAATPRVNPYFGPFAGFGPEAVMAGVWAREILGNIAYEMNGQVKQAGRGANAATIESFGLATP